MSGLQLPTKTDSEGTYVVWDVVPRDVSVDADGDMYVIDAGDQLYLTKCRHFVRLRFPARGKIYLLVHDRRAKASRRSERSLEIREVIDVFLKINDLSPGTS